MNELTAKQEAFANAVASGKSQADAYRAAFNAGSMKPETIHSKASVLMRNGKGSHASRARSNSRSNYA